jgi:hypothetical protein
MPRCNASKRPISGPPINIFKITGQKTGNPVDFKPYLINFQEKQLVADRRAQIRSRFPRSMRCLYPSPHGITSGILAWWELVDVSTVLGGSF